MSIALDKIPPFELEPVQYAPDHLRIIPEELDLFPDEVPFFLHFKALMINQGILPDLSWDQNINNDKNSLALIKELSQKAMHTQLCKEEERVLAFINIFRS